MADMLQEGLEFLSDQQAEHQAQTITYTTAAGSVTLTNARVSRTPFRHQSGAGESRLEWSEIDVLVKTEDLVIAGSAVTPARGDRFTWGSRTYDVGAPKGVDEPPARHADPYGIDWRIHAKKV